MARGLVQQDVAKLLGVNSQYLSSWELNRKACLPRHLESIIDFLGYIPKLKSKFDRLETRLKLWRIKHDISMLEISEITEIPLAELKKIETARYCKIDKKTIVKLEKTITK